MMHACLISKFFKLRNASTPEKTFVFTTNELIALKHPFYVRQFGLCPNGLLFF